MTLGTGPLRFALDANFPQPLLNTIAPFINEVQLTPIQLVHPKMADLLDWQVIVALHRRGFHALVTNDYHMLYEHKVLAALQVTRLSLIAIESLGHDPVRATGALLMDLPDIAKKLTPGTPKVFFSERRSLQPHSIQNYFERRAAKQGITIADLVRRERLSNDDRMDPLADDHLPFD